MSKKINSNRAGPRADAPLASFASDAMPPLGGDTGADVCVVGASFVGLRTAYDLLQKGKTVVVIESGAVLPERGDDGQRATLHDLMESDGEAATGAGYTPSTSSEMAHAIVQLGGRIHGGTRALDIRPEHNMQVVKTIQGAIVARVVVLATAPPPAARGNNTNSADGAEPGSAPALRILTTPAPNLEALFNPHQRRAA